MRTTLRLLAATPSPRKPLIKFLGPRSKLPSHSPPSSTPTEPSEPVPHPESPTHALPDSFRNYRNKAIQHGPLAGNKKPPSRESGGGGGGAGGKSGGGGGSRGGAFVGGAIGGHSGHQLGSVKAGGNEVFDRSELPARFGRMKWTEEEIEAVELGGAGVAPGWGGA